MKDPAFSLKPLFTLRQQLKKGVRVVSGWLSTGACYNAELLSRSGFKCVTVDFQHGLAGSGRAAELFQAVKAGEAVGLGRVAWNDSGQIMRLLDCGAMGIICPMTNTKAEVERFTESCRYAPRGKRSFGPLRASVAYGNAYFDLANEAVITMAMIETQEALSNLEAILSVKELDGVFVGPNDLGIALGVGPVLDGENAVLDQAVERIAGRAREAGKFAGIFCGNALGVKRRAQQGYTYLVAGNDALLLKAALQSEVGSLKAAGFL